MQVEIEVDIKGETEQAYLVTDGDVECWLPKSQIDYEKDLTVGDRTDMLVPEWLAEEKGLI